MRGRPTTRLSPCEHRAFSHRYTVLGDRDAAVVIDNVSREQLSVTEFRKLHGALGDQWLLPKLYPAAADESANDDIAVVPSKHPYTRQEMHA